jgi:predicted DNA-binding ribbon-helix-helix protein
MALVKRSVALSGHQTSVALEPQFWAVLEQLAAARGLGMTALIRSLDETRGDDPLASTARLAALAFAGEARANQSED